MEFAEIRKRKQARTETVFIVLDGSLRAEYDRVKEAMQVAQVEASRTNDNATHRRAASLVEDLEALTQRLEDDRVPFVFRACGRKRFDELIDAAPPRERDITEELEFNPDLFIPPLLAECAIDPTMTLEEAQEIYDDPEWSDGEITRLANAAYRANKEVRDVPFIVAAIGATRASAENSTTADPEG